MNDATRKVSDVGRPLRTISEIRSFFRTNVSPDLLRGTDRVQPARHRPLGPQLRLPRLLRLLGRRPSAGVHPEEQAVRRVREQRGDQQLPAAGSRGAGPRRVSGAVLGRGADDRDGVLRRGDRADLRGAGLQPDPPAGLAATAPGLQDRDDSPRRGGGGPLGAQCPRTCRQPTPSWPSSPPTRVWAPTWSCRHRTATRARRPSSSRRRATGGGTPSTWSAKSSRS